MTCVTTSAWRVRRAGSYPNPVATTERATDAGSAQRMGAPSSVAPPSSVAVNTSRWMGETTTPATVWPSSMRGERHAEAGDAVDEVDGAVDGVDGPRDPTGSGHVDALFALDAVVGSCAQDAGGDVALGPRVELGHQVGGRALGGDGGSVTLERRAQALGDLVGDLGGEGDQRMPVGRTSGVAGHDLPLASS